VYAGDLIPTRRLQELDPPPSSAPADKIETDGEFKTLIELYHEFL
jgi:hypothetical protein